MYQIRKKENNKFFANILKMICNLTETLMLAFANPIDIVYKFCHNYEIIQN